MSITRVVLWDVDGVLVDSEPLHREKLLMTAARYGVGMSEEDFSIKHNFMIPDGQGGMKEACMPLHGAGDKNIYYWALSRKPGLEKELTLNSWLEELFAYYVANKAKLQPRENIVELIDKLHEEKVIQGIVTTGIPLQVKANLFVLPGVEEKMAFILDADTVTRSKPHPEPYDLALTRLAEMGVNPACAAINATEDSPPGVRSSLEAGKIIGLKTRIDCVQFLLPGQKPVDFGAEYGDRLVIARSVAEVETGIYTLFNRREAELKRNLNNKRFVPLQHGL